MQDTITYNTPLVALSVVIAVVAGTAALWAGTAVRSIKATLGASLIMGVAVSGMHYTGMAAMKVFTGSMTVSGVLAFSFVIPLVLGLSMLTLVLAVVLVLAPDEDEIKSDAALRGRAGAFGR
jgi:NO-binding membrane sensor protein with MHYT domain